MPRPGDSDGCQWKPRQRSGAGGAYRAHNLNLRLTQPEALRLPGLPGGPRRLRQGAFFRSNQTLIRSKLLGFKSRLGQYHHDPSRLVLTGSPIEWFRVSLRRATFNKLCPASVNVRCTEPCTGAPVGWTLMAKVGPKSVETHQLACHDGPGPAAAGLWPCALSGRGTRLGLGTLAFEPTRISREMSVRRMSLR